MMRCSVRQTMPCVACGWPVGVVLVDLRPVSRPHTSPPVARGLVSVNEDGVRAGSDPGSSLCSP